MDEPARQLSRSQHQQLRDALSNSGLFDTPARRSLLLTDLPPALTNAISRSDETAVALNSLINIALGWGPLEDGTPAVYRVIENAIQSSQGSATASVLTALLNELTTAPILATVGTTAGPPIRAVAVAADGQWATSWSNSKKLIIWDLTARPEPADTPAMVIPDVTALAPARDPHTVLVVAGSNRLTRWNVESGQQTGDWTLPLTCVTALAVHPDGQQLLIGTLTGAVALVDLAATGAAPIFFGAPDTAPHSSPVSAVHVTEDRRGVSATRNSLRYWGLWTRTENQHFILPNDWLISLAVLTDGQQIVYSNGEKQVKIWDLAQRTTTHRLAVDRADHPDRVILAVAASADGNTIVAGRDDGSLCVWRLTPGAGTPRPDPAH